MSVNKHRPHVLVLPEDDANRQMANGFWQCLDPAVHRRMQVLNEAGGWTNALRCFESDHIRGMDRYDNRFMVLLIDFDESVDRRRDVKNSIPARLADRVFVLGAISNPERLRSSGLGSYEEIGFGLAEDCRAGTDANWSHELLRHNSDELTRLCTCVRPILF